MLKGVCCYPSLLSHSWYPPGHGDVYESFKRSGLLEKFIKEGKELVFISNIDNLGATIDLSKHHPLLGTCARSLILTPPGKAGWPLVHSSINLV